MTTRRRTRKGAAVNVLQPEGASPQCHQATASSSHRVGTSLRPALSKCRWPPRSCFLSQLLPARPSSSDSDHGTSVRSPPSRPALTVVAAWNTRARSFAIANTPLAVSLLLLLLGPS